MVPGRRSKSLPFPARVSERGKEKNWQKKKKVGRRRGREKGLEEAEGLGRTWSQRRQHRDWGRGDIRRDTGGDARGWQLQGVGMQAPLLLGSWVLQALPGSPHSSSSPMGLSGQHTGPIPEHRTPNPDLHPLSHLPPLLESPSSHHLGFLPRKGS